MFKHRLLGLECVQFQLAPLKVPEHLCFLGVEVATQLLFEPVVVLLEFLDLFDELNDLFVDLTGAKLDLEDVLLGPSRDHTPIETSTICADNLVNTTLLQLSGTCEVLSEHLVPNEVPNSLLQEHLRSGNLNHLIHVNGALNSVEFRGQALGEVTLRNV